jgi:ankyrin repeat protein
MIPCILLTRGLYGSTNVREAVLDELNFCELPISNQDDSESLYSVDIKTDDVPFSDHAFTCRDAHGDTPLLRICREGDISELNTLLQRYREFLTTRKKYERNALFHRFLNESNTKEISDNNNKRAISYLLERVTLARIASTDRMSIKQNQLLLQRVLNLRPEITEDMLKYALEFCDESICLALMNMGGDSSIVAYESYADSVIDVRDLICEQTLKSEFFNQVLTIVSARNSSAQKENKLTKLEEYLLKMRNEGLTLPMLYARDNDISRFNSYVYGHPREEGEVTERSALGKMVDLQERKPTKSYALISKCRDNNDRSLLWYAAGSNSRAIASQCFMSMEFAFPISYAQNPLIHAAERGSVDVLTYFFEEIDWHRKTFLDRAREVVAPSKFSSQAISEHIPQAFLRACFEGQLGSVEALLTYRPDLAHLPISNGFTALTGLIWAAHGTTPSHLAVCKYLLENGANVHLQLEKRTALYRAAKYGSRDLCKLFLWCGADPNVLCEGESPLIIAAKGGHIQICQMLVQRHAQVQQKDRLGNTALWYALEGGHEELATFLIREGAWQVQSSRNYLECAAQKGMHKVVLALIDCYDKAAPKIEKGLTPLMIFVRSGCSVKTITLLCRNKKILYSIDAQDDEGNTALMHAAMSGHIDAFIALLELTADPNIKREKDGMTALMLLAQTNPTEGTYEKYRKILLPRYSVGLDLKDMQRRSELIIAAASGNRYLAQLLIEKKVKSRYQSPEGTAYDVAMEHNHLALANFLAPYCSTEDPLQSMKRTHLIVQMQHKVAAELEEIDDISTDDESEHEKEVDKYVGSVQFAGHTNEPMSIDIDPATSTLKESEAKENLFDSASKIVEEHKQSLKDSDSSMTTAKSSEDNEEPMIVTSDSPSGAGLDVSLQSIPQHVFGEQGHGNSGLFSSFFKLHRVIRPTGIENVGNTCYINSALQCCFAMKMFDDRLRRSADPKHVTNKYLDLRANCSTQAVRAFCKGAQESFHLEQGVQEDAGLFLRRLLTHMIGEAGTRSQELKELMSLNIHSEVRYRAIPDAVRNTPDSGRPILGLISQFFFERSLTASTSTVISEQDTSEVVLPLSLSPQDTSLRSCVNNYFAPTTVDNYRLPSGELATVTKQEFLVNLPEYIVLSLQRTVQPAPSHAIQLPAVSLYHPISFELERTFDAFLRYPSKQEVPYRLIGVIFFNGTENRGHYFSYIQKNNGWYCCNDLTIEQVSLDQMHAIAQKGCVNIGEFERIKKSIPVSFLYEKIHLPTDKENVEHQ